MYGFKLNYRTRAKRPISMCVVFLIDSNQSPSRSVIELHFNTIRLGPHVVTPWIECEID